MLVRSAIKRLTAEERHNFKHGTAFVFLTAGSFAYVNYRRYIQKDFLRSHAYYRLGATIQNMTPWGNMYFTWFRMPREEYEYYHRFMPYYVIGQIDYSKEILIPAKKIIDGKSYAGYDVINPLYCYEGGKVDWPAALNNTSRYPVTIEKSGIILNRGWIPVDMKNKKTRPWETDSTQLVKVQGTFRRGKDIHDYTKPNDPNSNQWHNLALEDIALFWELPNFDEAKFYYFQALSLNNSSEPPISTKVPGGAPQFPMALNPDELVTTEYNWKVSSDTHRNIFRVFGSLSAVSLVFCFLGM